MKDKDLCFIKLRNGKYVAITYSQFKNRKLYNTKYKEKKFIPVQGMLLEVSKDDYQSFYKDKERNKYLRKQLIKNKTVSLESNNKNFLLRDLIKDKSINIEFEIERKEEIERLNKALLCLKEDEYNLIKALFYEEKTIREYAKILGIPFTTIASRKKNILIKLKNILKNL